MVVVFVLQLPVEEVFDELIKGMDLLFVRVVGVFSGEEYRGLKVREILM